jgi:hypothetical protein
MDGAAARAGVVEAAGHLTVLPVPRPGPVDLQQPADPRGSVARTQMQPSGGGP